MIGNYKHTKRIVVSAMLAALGFALSFLEFALFPAAPFLKLDLSNVCTLLGGFLFGPAYAVVIELAKQLLCFAAKSSTGGIGELANFIVTSAFVLPGSVLYLFKRNRKSAFIGIGIGVIMQVAAGLLSNRFILFPLYLSGSPLDPAEYFNELWPWIMLFNVIKAASVGIVVMLLYKPLSRALKGLLGETKAVAKKTDAGYNDSVTGTDDCIITHSASETEKFAENLASKFKGGEVLLLSGDLGAGKTVFAKGVARALGVSQDVKSPTFTLLCEYAGTNKRLKHIDAYRLNSGEEAEACGLTEDVGAEDTVTVIEWPEKIQSVLPLGCIRVEIERIGDAERKIKVC